MGRDGGKFLDDELRARNQARLVTGGEAVHSRQDSFLPARQLCISHACLYLSPSQERRHG
jgi:hypothetical protein